MKSIFIIRLLNYFPIFTYCYTDTDIFFLKEGMIQVQNFILHIRMRNGDLSPSNTVIFFKL